MSIFTHTFPEFIRDQLALREEIISLGNNGEDRTKHQPLTDVKGQKIPAGAFFTNTIERQCTIRLSSGVDLNSLGEENILRTAYERDNWKGENLAKNWILEGGVMNPEIVLPENKNERDKITKKYGFHKKDKFKAGDKIIIPRGGFGGFDSAYGDPSTRSDAFIDEDGDAMGIVPMPGIVDASIKVKSAYGSLREAQVNFVCHNKRQLEILELLYMRVGYTLLLEWGWSPHIKHIYLEDGKKAGIDKSNDFFIMNEFFDGSSTFEELQSLSLERREKSGGNYDSMVGYCKNFKIEVREDGGYDCSTSIISMGEILEGIKGRNDFGEIRTSDDPEGRVFDKFEVYMTA